MNGDHPVVVIRAALAARCGHWQATAGPGGSEQTCVDCGQVLPRGWHDMDEDEKEQWW